MVGFAIDSSLFTIQPGRRPGVTIAFKSGPNTQKREKKAKLLSVLPRKCDGLRPE